MICCSLRGGDCMQGYQGCSSPDLLYRCTDCFGGWLFCQECIGSMRKHSPFHITEVSSPFTPCQAVPSLTPRYTRSGAMTLISLKSLSLHIQLGHRPGVTCVNPKRSPGGDFVALDCNGIHEVGIDYCGCEGAKTAEVQLLQSPAPTRHDESQVGCV